jgi:hypothetical protein
MLLKAKGTSTEPTALEPVILTRLYRDDLQMKRTVSPEAAQTPRAPSFRFFLRKDGKPQPSISLVHQGRK